MALNALPSSSAHTPSDEICLRYASGVLDPALRLLVDAHLARCETTRARIALFTQLGATLLDAEEPATLTAGSLDRAFARIAQKQPHETPEDVAAFAQPSFEALSWRWAGPGRRIAPISVPGAALKTFVMKIGPGLSMLAHGHDAAEWTVILEGAYIDEGGRFETGAFIEENEQTVHQPVADTQAGCVCLIATAGSVIAGGLTGRFARWAMR
ncbi:MAG: cupin domain-containing protein [Hyphomicrobiales bacterium]|nr:cupin domain-containing protein [Hyphomicrobiales bacterium]